MYLCSLCVYKYTLQKESHVNDDGSSRSLQIIVIYNKFDITVY